MSNNNFRFHAWTQLLPKWYANNSQVSFKQEEIGHTFLLIVQMSWVHSFESKITVLDS